MRNRIFTLLLALIAGVGTMFAATTNWYLKAQQSADGNDWGWFEISENNNGEYVLELTFYGGGGVNLSTATDEPDPNYITFESLGITPEVGDLIRYTVTDGVLSAVNLSHTGPCLLAYGYCGPQDGDGDYGDNLKWELSCDGTFTVTGTGKMADWNGTATPWEDYKGSVVTVILPEDLATIGVAAFKDCANLTSIVVPDKVTVIGQQAFRNCTSLTEAVIGNSVTLVDGFAFYGCTSLKNVRRGSYVRIIGEQAFRGCGLTSIHIPKNVTGIGEYAFCQCTRMTSLTFNNCAATVGQYAFKECTALTKVTLGDNLIAIGASAFEKCGHIVSLDIPKTVTTLGDDAFRTCSGLKSVTFHTVVPPAVGKAAFYETGTMFYVPCGSTGAYAEALNVKAERIEENVLPAYSVTPADQTMGTVIFTKEPASCDDLTLSFHAVASKSCQFLQWSDGNADNPRTIELTQDTAIIALFAPVLSDIVLRENEDADYYNQFAEDYNGRTVTTATLNRQFAQGKWATLCLPFDVRKAQMMSLGLYGRVFEFRYAEVTESNTLVAHFAVAQSIEAGKGYIVNANAKLAAKTSFVFPSVTVNTESDNGDIATLTGYNDNSGRGSICMVGTLRTGTLYNYAGGNTYLGLKDNMIYYPNTTTGTAVRAYRGFFRSGIGGVIEEGDDDDEPAAPQRVRIVVEGGTVTELEAMNGEADVQDVQPARKFIDNGILYIRRNGKTYTAQGAEL